MSFNWDEAYNMLFAILNNKEENTYFSGSQFLDVVREFDWSIPNYMAFINQRKEKGESTTRRYYYRDILDRFDELTRIEVYKRFIEKIKERNPESDKVNALEEYIKNYYAADIQVPTSTIEDKVWNSDRLRDYLERMDEAIAENDYNYAITLAYTCLEGFYKAFIEENIPEKSGLDDLGSMAKEIRKYIEENFENEDIDYPENMIILITTITYAIGNSRNQFSDSHFDNEAENWLAEFCRDCVNSVVRLILKFT